MMQQVVKTRFRYFNDSGVMFVGEAEIGEDGINILECWEIGTGIYEIFPYAEDRYILPELEIAVRESLISPPATPVELPSDWNQFVIEKVTTVMTVKTKMNLPAVCGAEGIIRGITPAGEPGSYIIEALCAPTELLSELKKFAAANAIIDRWGKEIAA